MTTYDGHVLGLIRWAALAVVIAGVLGAPSIALTGGDRGLGTAVFLVVCAYAALAALPVYVVMGRMQRSLLAD